MLIEKVFTSFESFGLFLERTALAVEAAAVVAPLAAAEVVHAAAIKKPGHYQPGIGPFEAWPRLKDSTLARRARRGINPNDEPLLEIGELRDSYVIATAPYTAGVGSELERALAHEVGNPINNTPARPVLGPALAENEKEAFEAAASPLLSVLSTGVLPTRRSSFTHGMLDVEDVD